MPAPPLPPIAQTRWDADQTAVGEDAHAQATSALEGAIAAQDQQQAATAADRQQEAQSLFDAATAPHRAAERTSSLMGQAQSLFDQATAPLRAPRPVQQTSAAAPSFRAQSQDEQSALSRVYQDARAAGLDDEGARVAQAIARTEHGYGGAVGDTDRAALGSRGSFQFFFGGGMGDEYAKARGISPDQAAAELSNDPHSGNQWALGGYLGNAIREGQRQGLHGSELATYAQRTGQRSVSPERAGANYDALGTSPNGLASAPPPSWANSGLQTSADEGSLGGERAAIRQRAESYVGTPYLWGGADKQGIDCSAFISRAWGVGRQTTDTLERVADPIPKEELTPGDAMNLTTGADPRGYGHVRMFDGWADPEHRSMYVYESSTATGGVARRVIPYDAAYTPMRLRTLAADPTAAAARLHATAPPMRAEQATPSRPTTVPIQPDDGITTEGDRPSSEFEPPSQFTGAGRSVGGSFAPGGRPDDLETLQRLGRLARPALTGDYGAMFSPAARADVAALGSTAAALGRERSEALFGQDPEKRRALAQESALALSTGPLEEAGAARRAVSGPVRRLLDFYRSVGPDRAERIRSAATQEGARRFGRGMTPERAAEVLDALERQLPDVKTVSHQVAPYQLRNILERGTLHSKFTAGLSEDQIVAATADTVAGNSLDRFSRAGFPATPEGRRAGAADFVERERRAHEMVTGSRENGPPYARVTEGQTLPDDTNGLLYLVFEDGTPRITAANHHFAFGSPGYNLHDKMPDALKRVLWGTNWSKRRLPVGDGRTVIDTPWMVGPEQENTLRAATLLMTAPDEVVAAVRSGRLTDPEDVAAAVLRGSRPRGYRPMIDAAKRAQIAETDAGQFDLGASLNANRSESLLLDPDLGDVRAIYVVGRDLDQTFPGTAGIVGRGGLSSQRAAELVQQKIREVAGKDVPILRKDVTATGSKLAPEGLSAAGRGGLVDRYTRAGFSDIGEADPRYAAGLGAAAAGGLAGYAALGGLGGGAPGGGGDTEGDRPPSEFEPPSRFTGTGASVGGSFAPGGRPDDLETAQRLGRLAALTGGYSATFSPAAAAAEDVRALGRTAAALGQEKSAALLGDDPEKRRELAFETAQMLSTGPLEPEARAVGMAAERAAMPAVEAILRQWDDPAARAGPALGQRVADARTFLARKLTDRRVDLNQLQHEVTRLVGGTLPPDMQVSELSRMNPAGAALLRVQDQVAPAIRAAGEDLPYVQALLAARGNVEVAAAKGAGRAFPGGVTAAQSADVPAQLERTLGPQRFGVVSEAADRIAQVNRDLRQMLVDSGRITQETADQWAAQYPNYTPTQIVDYLARESGLPIAGQGRSLGVRAPGIHALSEEGTARARLSPIASTINNVWNVENLAMQQATFNALHNWVTRVPEMAQRFQVVDGAYAGTRAENAVRGYVDGQLKTIVTPFPEMARVLRQDPQATIPVIGPMMQVVKELITARNPAFLVGNAMTDFPTYLIRETARAGGMPTATARAVGRYLAAVPDAFGGLLRGEFTGPATQRYLAQGGSMESWAQRVRSPADAERYVQELRRSGGINLSTPADVMAATRALLTGGTVKAVGERIELVPRVAAFRAGEAAGLSPARAVTRGRDVTVDFAEGGTWAKTLNQAIPFLNPSIQGGANLARTIYRDPKGAGMTFALGLVAPTLALEAWNHADPEREAAYADVPDYVKDRGWVVMLPGPGGRGVLTATDERGNPRPQYFALPLREFAPVVAATRAAGDVAYGRNTRSWADLLGGAVQQVAPTADFGSATPLGARTALELWTNRDFYRGSSIATQSADERASLLSQALADGINDVAARGGAYPNVRPSQVEFAGRENLGVLAQLGAGASDLVTGRTAASTAPQDIPVLGGFLRRAIGGATGQRLEDAREARLDPDVRRTLYETGLATDVATVPNEIRTVPLRQAEQAAYQLRANQLVNEALRAVLDDPRFAPLPLETRKRIVSNVVQGAKRAAAGQTLGDVGADEARRRSEAERAKRGG